MGTGSTADFLRRDVAGKVRVSMRGDVDYRDGLKTASVFGTLPGTTDEDIYELDRAALQPGRTTDGQ